MTTRGELEGLSKEELMSRARRLQIRGRSTMTKAELVEALLAEESPPPPKHSPVRAVPALSAEDRAQARARRDVLDARLRAMVDGAIRCDWRSVESHPCGLAVVAGLSRCGLHGGDDIFDRAIPLTGHLGFDTWPALLRQMVLATYDVDPIGLDPVFSEMVWHVLNGLYFDYFRVQVDGIEHVPMDGPAVLVANHGGAALPYDGVMLTLAVSNEAPQPRRVRVVGTEIFNMLPFVSHLYRKAGAAYAAREDAEYLLGHGRLLGVFPEGERGFMKPVSQAYEVQRFGRGGFVELAEGAGAPIVPVAIVGAEEVHPAVGVSKTLARLVRLVFPQQRVDQIALYLNPLPLPVRWRIRFLPPLEADTPGESPDPLRVLERTEEIRETIQDALEDILRDRRTAF